MTALMPKPIKESEPDATAVATAATPTIVFQPTERTLNSTARRSVPLTDRRDREHRALPA